MAKGEERKILCIEERIGLWWSDLQRERRCNSTNAITKVVNKSSLEEQEKVRSLISNYINDSLSNSIRSKDIDEMTNLCNAINGCFDNFSHAANAVNISFNEIICFIDMCINECSNELFVSQCSRCNVVKILDLLHCISRVLVLILKLRRPSKIEKALFNLPEIDSHVRVILSKLSYKLGTFLKVDEILMDTKCNFVMASLLIREVLMKEKEKLLQYHKGFLETLPRNINEKEYKLNTLRFLLSNAVLNTWSSTVIDACSTGIYLRFFIQLCESYSSDTAILLNISRALLLLVKNDCFKEYMINLHYGDFHLIDSLLSCVYMLLDHPVPCVRHSSKDFLRLLVVYEKFKLSMLKSISRFSCDKRSYFICLAALANEAGSRSLLEMDQALPNNLVLAIYDPTLVTYVVNALDNVIVKDNLVEKDFSEWCETWIVPLLVSLSKVPLAASADIEKLLDSLFRRYPSAVFYVIDKWSEPKNDEELRYIMAALKIYHKHGFKKQKNTVNEMNVKSGSDLQENKWKDLISEKLLRFCIHHSDDDIRVSAFSLIIQGLKSTEVYTEQDFSLIRYSLVCNLNNQHPATRQKVLSVIKKMLARYTDSLAVLKRNQKCSFNSLDVSGDLLNYSKFQDWLFNFCFLNIFDGANFNRLNTILSIILICLEHMEVEIDGSSVDVYWRKILVPLRSSYEENKKMAVTLAKKLNISKLIIDFETMKLLFTRAYELCGKMEPPNVLTGAYLMQVLIEFPLVKQIAQEYMTENMHEEDSNLVYILLLSRKLKEQVCGAEKNLVKAAVSAPMYGTLFAIRVILQEVDFLKLAKSENVSDDWKSNWSLLLNDLIGLSFRMIHVVSCVVNSSSPEGHLPSDFQYDFEYMFNEDGLNNLPVEINSDRVEDSLRLRIQNIKFDGCGPTRTSEEIVNCCEGVIRRFNKVFLSYSSSSSYSQRNAVDFSDLLTECVQLIYELNKIQADVKNKESIRAYGFLKCLYLMEDGLKNGIRIYEMYNCKKERPTAQVLLLCSWRSIKEACLFLGDLVSKLPLEKILDLELVTEEMIVTIGEELRTLLCEIKHRGAFEQAYIGFSQLITALWRCPRKNLSELPSKWLQEILDEIKQPVEKQKMKLCSSRRSAGLPFLVQAIISSELQCTNSAKIQTLDMAMNTLLSAVEEEEEASVPLECKIHSLNILRALFKHAMFGEYVAPYVSRGLMVAISGSRAAAWSIRNSSSLLFSSLVIRIFGVARNRDALSKKNRMTGRHFFQRYPELHGFFLNEMKLAFQDDHHTHLYYPQPHVFHVLLILGRLYPPPTEDPLSIDFSEFLPFIDISCRNPTLKIRELGAKALVPLINAEKLKEELDIRFSFLKADNTAANSNHRHGVLLQVKTILSEMVWEKNELVKESLRVGGADWIRKTDWIIDVGKRPVPYIIKVAYIQILHIMFQVCPSLGKEINELLNRKELLDNANMPAEFEKSVPGRFAYLETLYFVKFDVTARIWLECNNKFNNDGLIRLFMAMLKSGVDEVQAVALRFLKYIVSDDCQDVAEAEDSDLITVRIKDLTCIQNENNFTAIKCEVLSQSTVLQYIVQCLLSLLLNVKTSFLMHKTIVRLRMSVVSAFLYQGLISVNDVRDSWNEEAEIPSSVLDSLSYLVDCGDSDISVGAFISYCVFFFEDVRRNAYDLKSKSVSYVTKLMFTFTDPDADVKQRAAASKVFNKYYYLFNHDLFKKDNQALSMWMLPLKLMSDEDPLVRRSAMGIVSKYQNYFTENSCYGKLIREFGDVSLSQITTIPSKAQETLLDCYVNLLDGEDLIHLIVQMVAWSVSAYINTINYEHITKQNEDGVFEKGNPNPFCEELTFGKLLCNKLEELKKFVDVKSFFRKKLDSTHIEYLQDCFPTLVFPCFPETLHEFCSNIVNILSEEDSEIDRNITFSCLPVYVEELTKAFDVN